ncbi:MAG: alpha/beta hydrolase-fold protein [Myxococcota bacterium]
MFPRALLSASIALMCLGGCASFEKRLDYYNYRSPTMGIRVNYAVYAPPDHSPEEELPLMVFLHGGSDDHQSFDRWEIGQRLDRAVAAGTVPRTVVVAPEGHLGFWANWADGSRHYEDWIVDELIDRVRGDYRTGECPEHCHLAGVSMGGAGSLRIALHRPDTFSTVGILSGPVFDTQQMVSFSHNRLIQIIIPTHRIWGPTEPRSRVARDDPYIQWATPDQVSLRIYLAWATHDRSGIDATSQRFANHLRDSEIPHATEVFEGYHNWVSWAPVIERAIRYQVAGEPVNQVIPNTSHQETASNRSRPKAR